MQLRMAELLTPIAQTYELKGLWTIRTIDIRSKYTVYGYVRECVANKVIPNGILDVILIFFYFVQDSFMIHGSDTATDIVSLWSQNDDILKDYKTRIIHLGGSTSEYNTAYGKNVIDPFDNMVHKWTLRMHRSNGDSFIGIDCGYDNALLNREFVSRYNTMSDHQYYAVSSSGSRYAHYVINSEENEKRSFTSGDKLCLIVDFSKEYGSMSISVNGCKYEKIFCMMHKSKLSLGYRLAVSLSVGSYVELINYCFSARGELDLYMK